MKDDAKLLAACGIDCTTCDIRLAPGDPGMRQRIVDWLRESLHREVAPDQIRCSWCKGDRTAHWSTDCWILHCCVDERRFEFCSECGDFPCPRLVEWSKQDEGYGRALKRLEGMARGT
jgi:hypothetical protein